jgi:hypothetical protein
VHARCDEPCGAERIRVESGCVRVEFAGDECRVHGELTVNMSSASATGPTATGSLR